MCFERPVGIAIQNAFAATRYGLWSGVNDNPAHPLSGSYTSLPDYRPGMETPHTAICSIIFWDLEGQTPDSNTF